MTVEKPEGYPFPDDELIYCSAYSDFDPGANSYTAVARLDESHHVKINGKRHRNTHRLVIHSPVRGPVSFLTNPDDMESMLCAAFALIAEDGTKRGGEGVASINPEFFERKTGVELDLSGGGDS